MRVLARAAFERVAGSRVVAAGGRRLISTDLRVLAYHDVADAAAFEAQMRHVTAHYAPVSASEVAAAFTDRHRLPPAAVWVTFDDGYPAVVEHAGPVLDRLGISATLFVCPGVLDTGTPLWFDVVRAALDAGIEVEVDGRRWRDDRLVAQLKTRPDRVRRRLVRELDERLAEVRGRPLSRRQLSGRELETWLAAGHDLGNHTWDHPCLDRCTPHEQAAQVEQAHHWLADRFGPPISAFAYPNGNWSGVVEQVLARLGYRLAVGFDHAVAHLDRSPFRVSRLRISADASLPRFRSIVSGLHSTTMSLSRVLHRVNDRDPRDLG